MNRVKSFIYQNHKDVLIFLLFIVIGYTVYYPAIHFHFFQDDYVWLAISKTISHNLIDVVNTEMSNFLMPTVHLYFVAAYRIFGVNPLYYHLTNIILHTINSFLVYVLLFRLTKQFKIALIGGIFFIVQRYAMDTVVWISAATELLTTLFLLLSTLSWVYFIQTKRLPYYILTLFFALVLIFTKEWSAVLLPSIIFVTLVSYQNNLIELKKDWKRLVYYLAPLCVIFAGYFIYQFFLQINNSQLVRLGYYRIGWHFFPHIMGNILLIFIPLVSFAKQHTTLWFIAGTIVCITGTLLAAWYWRKTKSAVPLLTIAWMCIAFMPTSFFTWSPFTSRYAYIPATGAALLVGYLVYSSGKKFYGMGKVCIYGFCCLFLLANVVRVHHQLKNYYTTVYNGNAAFAAAVQKELPRLVNTKPIIFYDNTPVKGFLLPNFMEALYNVPEQQVQILSPTSTCLNHCWTWNIKKQQLELIKP